MTCLAKHFKVVVRKLSAGKLHTPAFVPKEQRIRPRDTVWQTLPGGY